MQKSKEEKHCFLLFSLSRRGSLKPSFSIFNIPDPRRNRVKTAREAPRYPDGVIRREFIWDGFYPCFNPVLNPVLNPVFNTPLRPSWTPRDSPDGTLNIRE